MTASGHFKLGLFVLCGAGLLVGAVLAVGAGRLFDKKIRAETFIDESVNGLEVGSQVKYRGVTIGRVTSMAFGSVKDGGGGSGPGAGERRMARYIVVDMSLDSRSFKEMSPQEISDTLSRMTEYGLRARIAQAGIGGGVYIEMDFVDPKLNPPPKIPAKPSASALYIPSAPSTMGQVVSAAERLANDLREANLPAVVRHVDGLVTSATGAVDGVTRVVHANQADVKAVVSDLPAITGRLKASTARVDDLLRDGRLDRALTGLSEGGAGAGPAVGDLRRLVSDLQTLVSTQQDDVQSIIADLRRTARNLAALSEDARDNPSRLLLGEPPPRKRPGE